MMFRRAFEAALEPNTKERKRLSWVVLAGLLVSVVVLGSVFYSDQEAHRTLEAERDAQTLRAELIIQSAPVALIMCGEDARISVSNATAETMFGYTRDELQDRPITDLLAKDQIADHSAKFASTIASVRESSENWLYRVRGLKGMGRHKDGSDVPVIISIRVIKYQGQLEVIASLRAAKESTAPESIPLPPIQMKRAAYHR